MLALYGILFITILVDTAHSEELGSKHVSERIALAEDRSRLRSRAAALVDSQMQMRSDR